MEIQDNPEEESGEKLIIAKRRTFGPSAVPSKRNKIELSSNSSPKTDETIKSLNRSLSEDSCATYAAHVANKLRSYTQQVRVQVEHAINNILYEADIGKYNNTNSVERLKMSPTISYVFDPNDYEWATLVSFSWQSVTKKLG